MADAPGDARLEQLERRVRNDPMSVAFAALAEEYRRAGRFDDAIATCRAGLLRHPAYLSARVTLGRALMDVGALDEAEVELQRVVEAAPENLAAIRCLADLHHQRGPQHQRKAHDEPASAEPPTPAAAPPTATEPPVPTAPTAPTAAAPPPAVTVPPPAVTVPPPAVTAPPPPAESAPAPAAPAAASPPETAAADGPIVPDAPAAPEAAPASPPAEDPVIADLEAFLASIVALREARDETRKAQ